MKFIPLLFIVAALVPAQAAVIQTTTTNPAYNGLAVSNTDLLQQAGVTTATVGYEALSTFGQPGSVLRDGSAGGSTTAANDFPTSVLEIGGIDGALQWSVTFTLDLAGAAAGYDLTKIDSFSGWSDVRASQKHAIYYSVVGSPTFTLLHSTASQAVNQGLKVSLTDGTGVLATGVDEIRFDMDSGGAGGHVYREIDVIGVATVPEPSAAMLGGLGLMVLLRRRR